MTGQVRRFSRTVVQRIGALNDAILSRDRPLGQSRLLCEIDPRGSEVRTLRSRLSVDSGYLSRLLRSLENDGLVVIERNEADGRVRTAYLTDHGLAERTVLGQRFDEAAMSLLETLTPGERMRLMLAMAEVERLLMAPATPVTECDADSPDH